MTDTNTPNRTAGPPHPAVSHSGSLSRFWWLVLFFWLAVSLASGLELSLMHLISRSQVLAETGIRLLSWLLMTLLVVWVSASYTLDRTNWKRVIWVYVATCVVSLTLVGLLAYLGPPPMYARPAGGSLSLFSVVFLRLTYQLPTFWGLVAVAHAIRYYERENFRKLHEAGLRERLVHARLHALQLQLNPHFLFNTLNSIASLVHESPATAEKMIEALSKLLRLALTNTGRQQVSLREELNFLDQYLLIERIRFGDRLRIETHLDESVLDDLVPVLILQPLVENAVKHGVETRLAPSLIQITAQPVATGNFLRLEVSNDGPVDPGKIEERVGLTNTRARLHEIFGPPASLELHPGPASGFVARILIPRTAKTHPRPNPELAVAL